MTTRHHYLYNNSQSTYHVPDHITQEVFGENNQLKHENAMLKIQCKRLSKRHNDLCDKEELMEKKAKKLNESLARAKKYEEGLKGDLATEVFELRRQNENLRNLLNDTLRKNAQLKSLFESELKN